MIEFNVTAPPTTYFGAASIIELAPNTRETIKLTLDSNWSDYRFADIYVKAPLSPSLLSWVRMSTAFSGATISAAPIRLLNTGEWEQIRISIPSTATSTMNISFGATASSTIEMEVASLHFGTSGATAAYLVTSAVGKGHITPWVGKNHKVQYGENIAVRLVPASGYDVYRVIVNGVSVLNRNGYVGPTTVTVPVNAAVMRLNAVFKRWSND